MSDLYKTLIDLCNKKGITGYKMCKDCGIQPSVMTDLKKGRRSSVKIETAIKIAEYFGVPVEYLSGQTNIKKEPLGQPVGQFTTVKVVASVRAGYDGTAIEDCEDEMEEIPKGMLRGYSADECRIFMAKGNSMYPEIKDGDVMLVHIQPDVDNGDIAIIIYNGDEGTVKKVRKGKNFLEMIPINPEYQTKRIEGEDLELCHIYGKVITSWRNYF